MPTVSLLLATKDSAGRLPFVLKNMRKLADEIVVGVDDSSTDDTLQVARKIADRCVVCKSEGYVESFLYKLFPLCSGNWILRIDDDEFLSTAWSRERIYGLDPRKAQVYAIPRYQITSFHPRPMHLDSGFTYQCRIYWNNGRFEPETRIHSYGVKIDENKAIRLPNSLSLLHVYLMMASKEERRRKVAHYEKFDRQAGHRWFYLYDEYPNPPLKPIPSVLIPGGLREFSRFYRG